MPRKRPQKTIEDLEKQIALLTSELNLAKRKSESLWCKTFDSLLEEGNDEETAEHFADKFSEILSNWAKSQRDRLAISVASSGVMPPYSECLNDLVVTVSHPGKEPEKLGDVPFPEKEDVLETPFQRLPTVESVPNPSDSLSDDAKIGPPKMKRVNVPKGVPGAVPIGLI